jgi:hypothetical protein
MSEMEMQLNLKSAAAQQNAKNMHEKQNVECCPRLTQWVSGEKTGKLAITWAWTGKSVVNCGF